MFFMLANKVVFEGVDINVGEGGIRQGGAKLNHSILETTVESLSQVIERNGTSILVVVGG